LSAAPHTPNGSGTNGPRAPGFVAFFVDRPIFASVVAILITLLGGIAFPKLRVSQYPPIAPPTVQVSANYNGASADVVERTITLPIEEQVNGTEGMLYMSSTSANDGTMSMVITFELGRDPDLAAVNVNNRVSVAEPRLPDDVRRFGVTVRKQAPDLLLVGNLISPDGSRDATFLSNYALINLLDTLKRVPGVGDVNTFGERRYAMRIWLDPERLGKLGLTASDVIAAVREQNVQIAAGRAGSPPAPEGVQLELPLRTKGRLSTVEDFEQIVIRAEPGGSLLHLGDVARVELGAQNYAAFTRVNAQPSTTLGIFQLPEANALDVARAVKAELRKMSERFPSGVEQVVRYDPTQFVAESIREVLKTLFTAIALVFVVVYVFLEDWRATLIPAVTIPVSLVGTLGVLYAIGFGINFITLFALVLAIGLVVDDAIVVVENVARLLAAGYPRREAVLRSMGEVTSAIVAATLVLGAVFTPVALLPGTTGVMLRHFGVAVTCAVMISLLNALTLSPALCALVMRPEREHKAAFFRMFDRGFAAVVERYDRGVRALLPRRGVVLGVLAALFAANIVLFQFVPTAFIPDEDQGYFITSFQLPDGASIERTDAVASQIEKILLETPGVAGFNLFGGFDALTGTSPPNFGSVFVSLDPWSERIAKGQEIDAVFKHIQPLFAAIPEARVVALNPTPVRGLSRVGGFEFELQDRGGGTVEQLAEVTQRIIDEAGKTNELRNLFTPFRPSAPQVRVDLDRTKAKTLGVRVDSVFETLQAFMGGIYINDFDRFGRLFRVYAQAEGDLRSTPEDVKRLWVRSERGEMVPLSTLVSLSRMSGPRDIPHYNVYRAAKIQGQAAPGYSSGQALDKMEEIARNVMPDSMSFEWTGTAYQERQAGNQARVVLGLSLIVVFLFLAAQYESWSLPFAILLVVPLAFAGALGGQALRGFARDIYCQIGLVTLIGLASKNSILIVEFAKRRHAEGLSLVDAAREAAEIRLRPVVMTAFAFILGVVPLVIARGAGAAARKSLGTTVFGGMLVATLLSLVLVPALFVIVQGIAEWVGRRLRGGPAEGGAR
jgi:hydrophobe/amphiphile efflux-1 (HAE1) family protein